MDAQVKRCVERLRSPLQDAVKKPVVPESLGNRLRVLCDLALRVSHPGIDLSSLAAWRRDLRYFESLTPGKRNIEVARGLRVCRQLLPPSEVSPRRRKSEPRSALAELPGVGVVSARKLRDAGFETLEDLVWKIPTRYDDLREQLSLAAAVARAKAQGEVFCVVRAQVRRARFARRGRMRWLTVVLEASEHDEDTGDELVVRFFNAHKGLGTQFPEHKDVLLAGTVKQREGVWEMANPTLAGRKGDDCFRVHYSAVPGVPAGRLSAAIAAAAERFTPVELLDAALLHRVELPKLGDALAALHRPSADIDDHGLATLNEMTSPWHRRLVFEDLLIFATMLAQRRAGQRSDDGRACLGASQCLADLEALLPFTLTGCQARAVRAIGSELARSVPMNRLLQGDVGSGKTIVAFAAILQVIRSGAQAALMVPTEILAHQHYETIAPLADKLGVRVRCLTASMPAPTKRTARALVTAGQIDLLIGTHALLSDNVGFRDLALVIIDEQHRFGVAQRARLRGKGAGIMPHLLVMTATPIPRTLSLTVYGDLDTTCLDEMPPGRIPQTTACAATLSARTAAYDELARKVAAGQQGYVVCPRVEPSEVGEADGDAAVADTDRDTEPASATATYEELCEAYPEVRFGLIHGRLSASDRSEVMRAFYAGDVDVLVATTVIEVGVDVPNANTIIIEDADRFGLAQLHQLRGRVGRGGAESTCVLCTRTSRRPATERLSIMTSCHDGFVLAERDLEMRGPGDLVGHRQSGLPKLRFGKLEDHVNTLLAARGLADELLADDPELTSHPELKNAVTAYERARAADFADAG